MAYRDGASGREPTLITGKDVLLVVDVQNDFLPGGSLAVEGGDAVVPIINDLASRFAHIVLTQDWHTPGHGSFASSHPGKTPFETIDMAYGRQVLWPDHCIQGTTGAQFAEGLDLPRAELVVRKGFNPSIDSYSGFVEADRRTRTGLAGYLKERGFERVFCAGLATDFCVAWTAIDAAEEGFETYVLLDATRAIDTNGSLDEALAAMRRAGVAIIETASIAS
ncbi:bifunctional nicotinamidase/pyrazinamidase [Fulvimarina endophytica]|uniref:Nicotinamidase n=1 Tax=Fulvimarina endophytica TaxID=2293836 RepID=A0A371X0Y5_9HYPH|nr:bifunctional nicotinamidase/pyrazinamidase [Fulvimarina endophytica]RFC62876.1 bifunctional nicotinamidase/pyrazinamidase [Fulvimarina endophytica]